MTSSDLVAGKLCMKGTNVFPASSETKNPNSVPTKIRLRLKRSSRTTLMCPRGGSAVPPRPPRPAACGGVGVMYFCSPRRKLLRQSGAAVAGDGHVHDIRIRRIGTDMEAIAGGEFEPVFLRDPAVVADAARSN